MNSPLPIRVCQFLLQDAPSNLLSPLRLLQLHSLVITTGLQSRHPSARLSLLKLYLSNPSTLSQATTLFHQIQEPSKWNLMIRHASASSPLKALSLFQEMRASVGDGNSSTPFRSDPFIYASLVKACTKAWAFLEGKSIHCHVIRIGLDYNVNIVNSLVSFYMGPTNLMSYAVMLFDKVSERSVVSVNSMISAHAKRGNLDLGMGLFVKMLRGCFGAHVKPNYITYVILISGCVEFGEGRTGIALHCCCRKVGLDCNTEICNVLIDFYAKFGSTVDAASVFGDMPEKDLISWNSMIWGYANCGDCAHAFSLLREMKSEDIGVDRATLSCLLSACAAGKDLSLGRTIHAHVKAIGLESDVPVGTALIEMYAKCGEVYSAEKVFDELPKKNIEYWNVMIHVYIEGGLAEEALMLFDQIKSRELELDEVTVQGLIMACRDTGQIYQGILVHSIVERNELFKESMVLGNAKCGNTAKARAVLDRMPQKDVISWTSMIVGYAVNGEGDKSLATFKQICAKKLLPNSVTSIGVLLECDHAGLVDEGRELYDTIQKCTISDRRLSIVVVLLTCLQELEK